MPGICTQGPIALVYPESAWYKIVTIPNMERIIQQHLIAGQIVEDLCFARNPLPSPPDAAAFPPRSGGRNPVVCRPGDSLTPQQAPAYAVGSLHATIPTNARPLRTTAAPPRTRMSGHAPSLRP